MTFYVPFYFLVYLTFARHYFSSPNPIWLGSEQPDVMYFRMTSLILNQLLADMNSSRVRITAFHLVNVDKKETPL